MTAGVGANRADGLTVLIAEDSPTQAAHLSALLESNGFVVVAARNGREALDVARRQRPAVIISDVVMPEMDGYALCREVKGDPALKDIPAILVTELSSAQDVFKGLDAGADNFLVKPYEEAHLISRISYLLANKRIRTVDNADDGVEIELAGKRHRITAERQQILDLLISTYAQAVVLYDRLDARQKELAKSYDTLNALYDIAGGLNRCRTEAEVTRFAVDRGVNIPGVRHGWLNLRQSDGFAMVGAVPKTGAADGQPCACERMLAAGELSAAVNIECCDRLADVMPVAQAAPTSHVSIPLTVDGMPAGVLNLVGSSTDGGMSDGERRTLTGIGIQISDAMERARLHEALERKVEERTRALQAEVAERRQAEEAARTASDRLFDAIESINATFSLWDADERLVLCNDRFRAMHPALAGLIVPGVDYETLARAGLGCGDADSATEAAIAERMQRFRLADGTSTVLRRGDTWLMSRVRRTRDGVVMIETDVTELKKVDIAKDEFLATVSHELRTPLTSIRSALALIEADHGAAPSASRGKLFALAQRNCARLMRIVDDLLDVARISGGGLKLELQHTALSVLLEQALESRRIGPGASKVHLDISAAARDVRLLADPLRIQQVIDNLLSNAIKFSAEDAPIELSADCRDDVVRVSVKDHGIGIPKAFERHVFDAFSQADSSSTRQKGGAGLGLRIAKTIVEAHRGTISFSSTEGQGTARYSMSTCHLRRRSRRRTAVADWSRAGLVRPALSTSQRGVAALRNIAGLVPEEHAAGRVEIQPYQRGDERRRGQHCRHVPHRRRVTCSGTGC